MSDNKYPSIGIIGTISQDLVCTSQHIPSPGVSITGDEYVMSIGGRGANLAIAFARLHHPTLLFGCVGNDTFGTSILSSLSEEGIHVEGIKKGEKKTGISLSLVPSQQSPLHLHIPGANDLCTPQYLDSYLKLRQPIFEIFCLPLDMGAEAIQACVSYAKEKHMSIVYYSTPHQPLSSDLYQAGTMTICTWEELYRYTKQQSPDLAIQMCVSQGMKSLVVLAQHHGIWYWDGTCVAHIPAREKSTADPTGSSDAFIASCVSIYLEEADIKKAIHYGQVAHMIASSRIGSHVSIPLREEVVSRASIS